MSDVRSVVTDRVGSDTSDGRAEGPGDRSGAFLLAAAVLLLAVAHAPMLWTTPSIERVVIVLVVGAAGLGPFVWFASRGDRAALALTGLLIWAAIGAALSQRPASVLLPGLGNDRAWLFWLAYAGWWSIGRRISPSTRRLVEVALVLGLCLNVGLAVLQARAGDRGGLLVLWSGRPMGFLGNPVYFGAFAAGVGMFLFVSASRGDDRRWWFAALPIGLAGLGANLSGSRVALGALLGLAVVVAAIGDRRRGVVLLASLLIGALAGMPLVSGGSTDRVIDGGSSGLAARTEEWKAGLEAWTEKPLQGWGVGRWEEATTPRATIAKAKAEDPATTFAEAHNLPIEVVVTVGLVGFCFAAAFVTFAIQRLRGPYAWAAGAIALTWMLQPIKPITGALVLFFAGMGWRDETTVSPPRRTVPRWTLGISAAALLAVAGLSIALVTASVLGKQAMNANKTVDALRPAESAKTWLPLDPEAQNLWVVIAGDAAVDSGDPVDIAEARRAGARLIDLDPAWYFGHYRIAMLEMLLGDMEDPATLRAARDHLVDSYDRYPNFPPTLRWLDRIDSDLGDEEAAQIWRDRLCAIGQCDEE